MIVYYCILVYGNHSYLLIFLSNKPMCNHEQKASESEILLSINYNKKQTYVNFAKNQFKKK